MSANGFSRPNAFFFVSRILILAGMVLVFMMIFSFIGALGCIPLFGVNLFTNPDAFENLNDPNTLNALKFVQTFVSIGTFFVPAWIFPKALEQKPVPFLGMRTPGSNISWLWAILIMILSIPLISLIAEWNKDIPIGGFLQRLEEADQSRDALTKAFTASDTLPVLLINLIVIGIVPALGEELLFRGALLSFLRISMRNIHYAVFVSALLFSAFHWQFSLLFPRLLLGMLLGYLYVYSGSIWPSILAHFVNNSIALVIIFLKLDQGPVSFLREDYVFPVYTVVLSLALTALLVFWMKKKNDALTYQNGE